MTEKHSYEIIVLDLDGTLTNRDKVITPKTKQRLMELQERGPSVLQLLPVDFTLVDGLVATFALHLFGFVLLL